MHFLTTKYSKRNSLGPESPTSGFGNKSNKSDKSENQEDYFKYDSIMPSNDQNPVMKQLQKIEDRPESKF